MDYITEEQIKLYMSFFRGREDVYARHWEKNGRSGWSPAYEFNWHEFMVHKAQGGTIKDFQNKRKIPFTKDAVRKHLLGGQEVGVYPLLDDNTSYFITADFDGENWQVDCKAFASLCNKFEIPVYLELSRSGQGSHAWIFFQEAYPAVKSRKIVLELIRKALKISEFEKEVSFDRLFPNQDYHNVKDGVGNLIALPLQGRHVDKKTTIFLNQKTFQPLQDQWEVLNNIQRISTEKLDSLYNRWTDIEKLSGNKSSRTEQNDTLQIVLKNQIYLRKDRLHGKLILYLRENLNFLNTEYLIKKKLGKSLYQTEKYFKLIDESDELIMIPRGFAADLIQFCKDEEIPYEFVDERKRLKTTHFQSKITLHDYQKEALKATEHEDFGVIVAPPASGKTIMGLELIVQKKQPTLILVHRKQLLDQWIERIQSFLGIMKKDIGQISGIKKTVGKQITVAMIQSLTRMSDLEKLKNAFGMIIVDECHHIPAKTFRELITRLNSYYLYGLTATPKRKYNDEKLIFVYIGNIISTVHPEIYSEVKSSNFQIEIRETDLSFPFDYKIDDIQILSKILIFDSARNKMIVEDVIKQVNDGRKILILTERKDHVDTLNLYLKGKCEVITITGDDSKSKRISKVEQIKMGHFQVVIATGQLFGEGVDINTLDCLFLVYPFSFEGKLVQYIGRIQRSSKQHVFDYRDKNVSFLEKLFKKRKRYYSKIADI